MRDHVGEEFVQDLTAMAAGRDKSEEDAKEIKVVMEETLEDEERT